MGGAQVRWTMARVIAESCIGDKPRNPGTVWLAPLADHVAPQGSPIALPAAGEPKARPRREHPLNGGGDW